MDAIERGFHASGECLLTTGFGEERISSKKTTYRSALGRSKNGVVYRLYAFGEDVLRTVASVRKGEHVRVGGHVIGVRDEIVSVALSYCSVKAIQEEKNT